MKRYYYNGKEISKFHANVIFVGAILSMIIGAVSIYACMWGMLAIGNILR